MAKWSARTLALSCLPALVAPSAPAALPASRPAPQRRLTEQKVLGDLRSHLDRLAADDRFSGVVLVAKNDKILFERAYGFANRALNAPNRTDTKFNLASMGKMFTGIAILQLAEQGKLSLDDTVLKLIPDYPNRDVAAKVTIHHLLTHTAGMPDYVGQEFIQAPKNQFTSVDAFLRMFVDKPLQFEPGTRFSYSNGGFIVLGLVIERVSGQSYYDYVREHIFEPARMLDTENYLAWDDVPNLALGYTYAKDDFLSFSYASGPRRSNHLLRPARGASAGGGYSTARDLLTFAKALRENKLLGAEYVELALAGRIVMPSPGGRNTQYAYGFMEERANGIRIVGHAGGGSLGISNNLDMYADLGYVVIVLSNYDQGTPLVNDRLRWLLTGHTPPTAIHLSADALRAFAGQYVPERQQQRAQAITQAPQVASPPVVIAVDRDGLIGDFLTGARHRYQPLSQAEFFDQDIPSGRLVFSKDERGQITGLTAAGAGPPTKARRVP